MRIISIILTLILVVAWGYTSWYWYACNIKGFCDEVNILTESDTNKEIIPEINLRTLGDPIGNPVTTERRDDIESQKIEAKNENNSQIINSESEDKNSDEIQEKIFSDSFAMSDAYCADPLAGPIELGKTNDAENVRKLEAFLMARSEDVKIDGVYGQDDFEAVKRFQLEYKDEILTPWDIAEPTGFVFTTTVKKINQIACP